MNTEEMLDPAAKAEYEKARYYGPEAVAELLADITLEEVEVFVVLALDTRGRVIERHDITRGLVNSSLVHPREVFRAAIASGASGVILAHNHPSGDPTPSPEDRAVTRQLVAAGRLLDIPVYDHIILGGPLPAVNTWSFTSFAAEGLL